MYAPTRWVEQEGASIQRGWEQSIQAEPSYDPPRLHAAVPEDVHHCPEETRS